MSSSNSSNSSMALKGHHVLVTGGSQGIGAAIVVDAAAEGARVSFFDIDVERGEALAAKLNSEGNEVLFVKADVSKF